MNRPVLWLLVALMASPAIAYGIYWLARELGFLDRPIDRQHELRRTIIASLYAFLLFLPVGIYGWEKGWPRVWILFGIVDGLAIIFFAAGGIWAGLQLWRLRHPEPSLQETLPPGSAADVGAESGRSTPEILSSKP